MACAEDQSGRVIQVSPLIGGIANILFRRAVVNAELIYRPNLYLFLLDYILAIAA
jgi:hypothetical protein